MAEFKGWKEAAKRYDKAPDKVKKGVLVGFRKYMTFLGRYAREQGLAGQVLHRRTGNLYRRTVGKVQNAGSAKIKGIIQTAPYGKYWEFGFSVPTYTIKAKKAKYLRFVIGNEVFFRKKVTIPARTEAARPWAMPAVEKTEKQRRHFVLTPLYTVFGKKGRA